jgi:predicted dehydrogenase
MIRVTSSVVGYLPDEQGWVKDPGEGGAWLDMGVHLFDALRWFTDSEVELVFARIRDFGGIDHLRRSGTAELQMRNGVIVQVLISFEMPPPGMGSQSHWVFIGESGIVESDSYGKVRLGTGDGWSDIYEMPAFDLNADVYSPIRLEAFAAQVADFAGAVRDGRPPAVGGHDGRAAVQIVEAGARSAETGQSVRLHPQMASRG